MILALIFDLILAGGRVVDGTGAPWFRADVGIRGDTIAAVGDLSHAKARRKIELHDLVIAPGFIDLLGQSERTALVDPREESKVRQGITTELTGEGVSPAPMDRKWIREQRDWLRRYKLKVDWSDLASYFARLRKARPSINEAVLVGLGQVRGVVLGMDDAQPTAKQLKQMQRLVKQQLDEGAFGVSTGLIYTPGSFAKTPELIALTRRLYATHLRSEGNHIMDALDEAFTIARADHVPLEIWHLKVGGRANWGRMKDVIAKIENARADGIDVTADMYPYTASANKLIASFPDWANAGGIDATMERLKDPGQRARIVKEVEKDLHAEDILLLNSDHYAGKRLDEVAKLLGKPPAEALVDVVELERGETGVARFGMSEDDVKLGLAQPWVALGTDCGGIGIDGPFAAQHPHPRCFGSTARILGHYARDEKLFSMEEAVRKMTSLPARRIGLPDRGLVKEKLKADLVVFDPAAIRDTATFEKPQAYPEGIPYVLVNGKVVLANGKRTRERPGRPLLHSR